MTRWCIDETQVVHNIMCKDARGPVTSYVSKPKTNEEMITHLARADRKDGHDLPGIVRGCEHCIPADEETP